MGPLVADVAELAGVVLPLPGQMLTERKAEFANPFGHRPQHQRQVSTLVDADPAPGCHVFAPQKFGPLHVRWQHVGKHSLDERRQALDKDP